MFVLSPASRISTELIRVSKGEFSSTERPSVLRRKLVFGKVGAIDVDLVGGGADVLEVQRDLARICSRRRDVHEEVLQLDLNRTLIVRRTGRRST